MKRVVCDTNILISGLLWKGAPRQVLSFVESARIRLFTSRALLLEMERVLSYPRIRKILIKAGLREVDILRWVVENTALLLPHPLPDRVILDDASDDEVLACAMTASADAIVSGDKHLLSLRNYKGIPILSANRFLGRLG